MSAGTSPAVAETIQPTQPASLNSAERDPAGRRSCGRGGARSRRRLLPCACGNPRSHKDAIYSRSAKSVKTGAQGRAGGAQRKKVPRSKRERGVKGKGKRQKAKSNRCQVPNAKNRAGATAQGTRSFENCMRKRHKIGY